MNVSADALTASYAACRRVSRQAKSSFYAGFLLLPHDPRRAMDALYAFMRHTDDLADNAQPVGLRARALARWRGDLEDALAGTGDAACSSERHARQPAAAGDPAVREDGDEPAARAILPALADAVARFQIPPEHLRAVIDGVEMDLTQQRYETFADLCEYCQRVASAVGLACIYVWGFRGAEALPLARNCGIALQLTNILRDVGADAQQGRVYLPLADLRACDYSVEDLLRGVADERFQRLMAGQIRRAEQYYRDGAPLLNLLEPCGRRVFGMMMGTYRSLLRKIKDHPSDVLLRRIRLSRPKKLQIAARWALLPPRAASLR